MTTTAPATSATSPCRGAVRVLRAVVPAVAAVLVALGGHVAGGGAVPSALVMLAVSVGAGALSGALAGRRWTPRTVVALLLALQGVVHLTCSMGAEASTTGGSTAAMVAWHLLATAVTTAALCWGESVLWSLVEAMGLGRAHLLLHHDAVVPAAPAEVRVHGRAWVPRGRQRAGGLRLRGPPVPVG